MSDDTAPPLFTKGGKGGPGRPKGSRNKVAEDFLRDLHDLWSREGPSILTATAVKSPETIVKVAASLLPKQVEITRPLEELSDDDLAASLEYLRNQLAKGAGNGDAASAVH